MLCLCYATLRCAPAPCTACLRRMYHRAAPANPAAVAVAMLCPYSLLTPRPCRRACRVMGSNRSVPYRPPALTDHLPQPDCAMLTCSTFAASLPACFRSSSDCSARLVSMITSGGRRLSTLNRMHMNTLNTAVWPLNNGKAGTGFHAPTLAGGAQKQFGHQFGKGIDPCMPRRNRRAAKMRLGF